MEIVSDRHTARLYLVLGSPCQWGSQIQIPSLIPSFVHVATSLTIRLRRVRKLGHFPLLMESMSRLLAIYVRVRVRRIVLDTWVVKKHEKRDSVFLDCGRDWSSERHALDYFHLSRSSTASHMVKLVLLPPAQFPGNSFPASTHISSILPGNPSTAAAVRESTPGIGYT